MNLNCSYMTLVEHAEQTSSGWNVQLRNVCPDNQEEWTTQQITCKHLVLANGVYNDPFIPTDFPNSFSGLQVHASRYTNATELDLVGKEVLVVGFGNSACEIGIDLVEHGVKPTMLVRSPQTIGKLEGSFQPILIANPIHSASMDHAIVARIDSYPPFPSCICAIRVDCRGCSSSGSGSSHFPCTAVRMGWEIGTCQVQHSTGEERSRASLDNGQP